MMPCEISLKLLAGGHRVLAVIQGICPPEYRESIEAVLAEKHTWATGENTDLSFKKMKRTLGSLGSDLYDLGVVHDHPQWQDFASEHSRRMNAHELLCRVLLFRPRSDGGEKSASEAHSIEADCHQFSADGSIVPEENR